MKPYTRAYCHQLARQYVLKYKPGPWSCDLCGILITHLGVYRGMGHVHHLNENYGDNSDSNLIVRCVSCHLKKHKTRNGVKIKMSKEQKDNSKRLRIIKMKETLRIKRFIALGLCP